MSITASFWFCLSSSVAAAALTFVLNMARELWNGLACLRGAWRRIGCRRAAGCLKAAARKGCSLMSLAVFIACRETWKKKSGECCTRNCRSSKRDSNDGFPNRRLLSKEALGCWDGVNQPINVPPNQLALAGFLQPPELKLPQVTVRTSPNIRELHLDSTFQPQSQLSSTT